MQLIGLRALFLFDKYLINNWERIVQIIQNIVSSIGKIAMGQLGDAAKFIENTLATFVPMLLDFLARLLRLGNVNEKIKKILQRVRKPIDDLIAKVMAWIKKKMRKFTKKKPKKGEGDDIKKENKKDGKPEKLTQIKGQIHKVAKKVLNNLADKDLMFITPTDIPRDVAETKGGSSHNFVKVNTNLRRLRTSKSKALYSETVYTGEGILFGVLKDKLREENVKFQVHHAHPMYLGGEHVVENLLTLFGYAGRSYEPHGMLHDFIDEIDITRFLDTTHPSITLDNKDLRKHFNDDKLKIFIGTLKTDGSIKYKKTTMKLKN